MVAEVSLKTRTLLPLRRIAIVLYAWFGCLYIGVFVTLCVTLCLRLSVCVSVCVCVCECVCVCVCERERKRENTQKLTSSGMYQNKFRGGGFKRVSLHLVAFYAFLGYYHSNILWGLNPATS